MQETRGNNNHISMSHKEPTVTADFMASLKFSLLKDTERHLAEVHESPDTPLDARKLEKLDRQLCGKY